MRVLISADWQVCYENVDKSEKCWNYILSIAKKQSLEAIVIAGDLKNQYNPVDIRVIKFWFKAIRKAVEKKIRVLILLGNHDREGLYTDSKNWLPLLRKAGAEVFEEPDFADMSDGSRIAMLPFTTKVKELRHRAKELSKEGWNNNKDILLFHADVKECKYNQLSTQSESKLKYEELYPDNYLACIGGHIHLPQDIGKNGYYVGSPFAMDWGEANQRKRFLLVLDERIVSVDSPLPGWFDLSWPSFYKPKTWKEARVRIHIDVDTNSNYKKILDRALVIAEREYKGAIIKIVPNFINEEKQEIKVNIHDSDEQKIKVYVKETLPDKLVKQEEQVISFLTAKLKESEGLRRHGSSKITFIDFKGKNFLSFKKIETIFRKQGLVLIEGTNKDWSSQSNGSGKTNYVQSIPVSLFGTTFKGQKYDRWARRQTKDRAKVKLRFKDDSNKVYTILRHRRPNWIQLLVNGSDHSTGLNKKSDESTQGRIESTTGFLWQILANSLYIDRSIANSFLTGNKSDRVGLLYKFQNLERFQRALLLVKKYKDNHNVVIEQNNKAIDIFEAKIEETKENLKNSEVDAKAKYKLILSSYRKGLKEWRYFHKKKLQTQKTANKTYRKYKKKYDIYASQIVILDERINDKQRLIWKAEQVIQKHKNIAERGKCPTCGNKVNALDHRKKINEAYNEVKRVNQLISNWKIERAKYNEKCALYEGEIDASAIKASDAKNKANTLKSNLGWMKEQIEALRKTETKSVSKIKARLTQLKTELIEFKEYKNQLEKETRFISYCEEAFNKDGLPAFINAQAVPILNKACEYYSDMFCDKEVLVQFEPDEGDIIPKIINLHGGEKATDQSNGEASIAGLITSFALKEIAPKTNVLILDEPEAGLSPQNIKRFAQALTTMKKRFETIFVVTHSPILLSELSNEKVIKIEKHHSVSKVINA